MSDVWISALVPSLVAGGGALWVANLQRHSNERIELLRAQLSQLSDRRRVIFERRANVLADVYALLVEAGEAFQDFLDSGTRLQEEPYSDDKHRAAYEVGERFRKAYTCARILIPEEVAKTLDAANREFTRISRLYVVWRRSGQTQDEALIKVYQTTEGIIALAMPEINRAFQAALAGEAL